MDYDAFLASKRRVFEGAGIEVSAESLHPSLFDWQKKLTSWALKKGRCALFTTTGSGKTRMQLQWALFIPGRVLILTPLAVAQQTVAEGQRIGVPAVYARNEEQARFNKITVANYEMLKHFDVQNYSGVVLDESSCLKNFSGTVKKQLIETFRQTPYRLCCTATPAPNDVVELCNHADFLGIMSPADMLSRFFISKGDDAKSDRFRLKRHAHGAFFRWLASWAMAMTLPSDLGYSDNGFILPPLSVRPHFVDTDWKPDEMLFFVNLKGVVNRAAARKGTLTERVQATVDLVQREPGEQWLIWTGLNEEAKSIVRLIPGAINVQGSDSIDSKVEALSGFASGQVQVLVTKLNIAGHGLNWQNCARMAFVGLSDSWEQYYQGLRRCWRFGQTRPVEAHIVLSTAEQDIYNNVMRKEQEAIALQHDLVAAVAAYEREELNISYRQDDYSAEQAMQLPEWLQSEDRQPEEVLA